MGFLGYSEPEEIKGDRSRSSCAGAMRTNLFFPSMCPSPAESWARGVHWATVRTSPKAPWREQTISGREYLRRAAALAATHGDSPKTHKIVCVFSSFSF